jgi:DNA polymerase III alpha subunit (gram-positive type)
MDEYIIYVIDTETTGLSSELHEIIELSALRFCFNDESKLEQKTWLIRALNSDTICTDALAVNGHKREDILWQTQYGKDNYIQPASFVPQFDAWVGSDDMSAQDRVFCGQNPTFDFDHMYATWKRMGSVDTFPFMTDHAALLQDTKQLALFFDICLGRKRDRYNLGALVKDFGIKKEKAHRADADTKMTKDLFATFVLAVKDIVKERFGNDSGTDK